MTVTSDESVTSSIYGYSPPSSMQVCAVLDVMHYVVLLFNAVTK